MHKELEYKLFHIELQRLKVDYNNCKNKSFRQLILLDIFLLIAAIQALSLTT
ncbi:hypothetical protein [Niallia sp. 03133]|uniref:hypothetical protein n=1 Tax=Niallia sp. 03133 TaxID=3458060 RepID=UPI004043D053